MIIDSRVSSVTIRQGTHLHGFSITVSIHSQLPGYNTSRLSLRQIPQTTECYNTDHWSNKSQLSCAKLWWRRNQKDHLLRKAPPSIGDSDSSAEVGYYLTVVVTGKRGARKVRINIPQPNNMCSLR